MFRFRKDIQSEKGWRFDILCMKSPRVKGIKIQFDELVSFHSISYLSVVSSMRFKCVLFSRKHPQKIDGIVISDKADLTKTMSP